MVWRVVADPLDGPPSASMDPSHPTRESTISEMVSGEIDPVLFNLFFCSKLSNFPQAG